MEPQPLVTLKAVTVEGQVEGCTQQGGPIGPTQPASLPVHDDLNPVLAGVVILDDEVGEVQADLGVLDQRGQTAGAVQVGRVLIWEVWSGDVS